MEIVEMYLENTTLALKGSWRKTKIEGELACDIACAMAARRCGDAGNDREHQPEAYRLLGLFIANEGRYPHDCLEVEARFPGCFEDSLKLRVVSPG
jgi:hypothetical protein